VRVLIDYRPALRERSGSGEYTHQLAKALLAAFPPGAPSRTLELTLFSSSWKDRLARPLDLAGVAVVDRRVPVSVLNFAWHRLGWPAAETIASGRFDVVHSPHPLLMPARRAAQVITIHDLNFLTNPERTRAEIRRDYPALAREHAHRAAAVLVPSAYTAGEVERLLEVPRDRMTICPPGAPDWTPRRAAPKDGYVLFFGTLEPRKNIGGLLDAYELLLNSGVPDLVFAGKATEDAQPWLDRITRPPLAGRVHHVGYVEAADRRALYEGARLLVQPSFDEGFGLSVLEAMTLGVPVVAADRGSLPEVLGGAGILANPHRPADIARAIAQVVHDDGVAAACRDAGIARARTFRWDETAHRVYDTYRNAIERRARTPRRG
jgi:glycosyltransferase involved in cell wall biosynthesis